MRKLTLIFPLLLLALLIVPSTASAQSGDLVIKVMDLENGNGYVEMTLYDKEKGFPEELEYSRETKRVKVNGREVVEIRWKGLPHGNYAIAGYHDENGSGEMDYNWIGMPTEGYCFSNDIKPVLSAPSYDDVKFKLDQDLVTLYIHMQN